MDQLDNKKKSPNAPVKKAKNEPDEINRKNQKNGPNEKNNKNQKSGPDEKNNKNQKSGPDEINKKSHKNGPDEINKKGHKNGPDEITKKSHKNEPEKQQFRPNVHVILLAVIALIIAVCAVRLYIWNKGVPSDYNPNEQTTDFDTEAMDYIIPLAPDKLEGHTDDGVTTILCLGDDPFSLEQGPGGLAEQIAAKTGATVYNGSFTGTTMAVQLAEYNDGYILDAFAFVNVARSLASGNFDLLRTAASYSFDESFPKTVAMLESVDMNNLDLICIMYDGSDYINKRPCEDPGDPNNPQTYTGALRSGIQAIQEAWPHIRIVVMSHTFCHNVNAEGNFENGDRVDLGNGTLSHYLQKELDTTSELGVSFIDNFYGSINEDNYLDYMTDYIHFNDAGRELLANRFVECIFPKLQTAQ